MVQEKFKIFLSGILFSVGAWIIVIAMREELLATFATTNQYIIGLALIGIAYLVGKNQRGII